MLAGADAGATGSIGLLMRMITTHDEHLLGCAPVREVDLLGDILIKDVVG